MPRLVPLDPEQAYGLIVFQPGKVQGIMLKYVVMNLNYRFGLTILTTSNINEAARVLRANPNVIRALFIIQKEKIANKMFVYALSLQGKRPLFLISPLAVKPEQQRVCEGLKNIFICPWEQAFKKEKDSLGIAIQNHVKESNLNELLKDESIPYEQLQSKVEQRVRNLQTLPSIPEIVLRIMKLVNDPNCNVEALENLLLNDPSIVQKLLQVVSSPIFSGAAKTGKWTLKEAIVRMGLQKAGAIAQQLKLMNTFVKPEDSNFDLRRFWEHSIGCAMLAEKICTARLITLEEEIPFDTYWTGAILHDIGKMILGLFFWDHFESVVEKMAEGEAGLLTFREAETRLGDAAHHVHVGQILLMKSNVQPLLVEAVRCHHQVDEYADELTCLLYLVNNLVKDLGLGYLPDEVGDYPEALLVKLKLDAEKLDALVEELREEVLPQIRQVVELCLSS